MTDDNIEQILTKSIKNLIQLGQVIENLINNYPDVFDKDNLKKDFRDFCKAHQESIDKLNSPHLSIAMIGTTSSGKSTVFNSLISHKIAPIDSQEKSTGLLTVKHHDIRKLVIEQNTKCEELKNLSNDDIYEKISNKMDNYKSNNIEELLKFTVFTPLLPACDLNLLELPPSMGIEFIDLPGLNTVLDGNNLKLIQESIKKAFSIVVLNYEFVNKNDVQALLKEVNSTIKDFRVDTDLMIFILNKCDIYETSTTDQENLTLPKRIKRLEESFQSELQLPVHILPFSSLSLLYAQCAWGPKSLEDQSPVDETTRFKLLEAMMTDCSGYLLQKIRRISIKNENLGYKLKTEFRKLEDRIDRAKHDKKTISIDDVTMGIILKHIRDWTGAKKLWASLRQRVKESLTKIILIPALTPFFINYDALKEKIEKLEEITQKSKLEEVEQKRKEYKDYQDKIVDGINCIQEKINLNIGNIQKTISPILNSQENNFQKSPEINNYEQTLRNLEISIKRQGQIGFLPLIEVIPDIQKGLFTSLITPVLKTLKDELTIDELEKKLNKKINSRNLKNIIEACASVREVLKKYTTSSGDLEIKLLDEESEALQNAERCVRRLYMKMQKAILNRYRLMLQARAKELESAMKNLIANQAKEIKDIRIDNKNFQQLDFYDIITTSYDKKQIESYPTLPDNLFNIALLDSKKIEREEVISQEKKQSTSGKWCFKRTITSYEPRTGNVTYLRLPNPDEMAKQWLEGIDEATPNVLKTIFEWIDQSLDKSKTNLIEATKDCFDFLDAACERQIELLENDLLESHKKQWNEIKTQLELAKIFKEELDKLSEKRNIY